MGEAVTCVPVETCRPSQDGREASTEGATTFCLQQQLRRRPNTVGRTEAKTLAWKEQRCSNDGRAEPWKIGNVDSARHYMGVSEGNDVAKGTRKKCLQSSFEALLYL